MYNITRNMPTFIKYPSTLHKKVNQGRFFCVYIKRYTRH